MGLSLGRDVDVTRELLQALLDHFWECRRKKITQEAKLFPDGYLISYSALIQRAAVVTEARRLGGPLTEIAELSRLKGWPPLAALVVRQDVGHPGVGYFRRADAPKIDVVRDEHLRGWERDAQACIAFQALPKLAPPIREPERKAGRKPRPQE